MTALRFALASAMTLSLTIPLLARQPSLAGQWTLSAEPVSGQSDTGGKWSRSAITGTLEIVAKDRTLSGTWTGPRGDAWPFTGRVQGEKFEIVTAPRQMPVTKDGRQTTEAMRWRFMGSVAGDQLKGMMVLERDGDESDRLQPFAASRKNKGDEGNPDIS